MKESGHYFRLFLNDELKSRCLKNPSYSLRSFAKSLNIDSSNLSKYMAGQRKISNRFFLSVRMHFKISFNSLEEFEKDYSIKKAENNIYNASEEIFSNFGELQAAILAEMLSLTTISPDIPTLAKITHLPEGTIEMLLLKMEELGLAESINGIWKRKADIINYKLKSNKNIVIKSSTILAEQMVRSLQEAETNHAQTHITGVISTDSALIEEAREKIKNFRRELIVWLENSPKKDTTFGIYLSLFPLVKTS